MKKILVASMMLMAAFTAGAQSMYDAINFSQNNYYGTARTMALGNAVTALGGDLGTIGVNPAGSAVASYGQFTITPGSTLSIVYPSYSAVGETMYSGAGKGAVRNKVTNMPNIGASFKMSTGAASGLKEITLAFVSNQTYNYNYSSSASGMNSFTSKLGEFAAAAGGVPESVLMDDASFRNSDVNWDILTAYQAGMFGSYDGGYVGNTEMISEDGSYHYVPGNLLQNSKVRKSGSKNDIVMNIGANISDRLYLGLNIGIPTAEYSYSEIYSESPDEVAQFPISFRNGDTYFEDASYAYRYSADMTGLYAKIGFIYLPTDNLRIGASFQTPTAYTIDEQWRYDASTSFSDSKYDGSCSSPVGEYSYCLRSPYFLDLGVAYTFMKRGFFSVDYELADYSVMRYSEYPDVYGGSSYDSFYKVNSANSLFCGVAHQLRVGAEYKISRAFSVRAGYNLSTSPEKYWLDTRGNKVTADDYVSFYEDYNGGTIRLESAKAIQDRTQSCSFGVGYQSKGSFFADFAIRKTFLPDTVFAPYYDYDNYSANGTAVNAASPRIRNKISRIDSALTLGWRF